MPSSELGAAQAAIQSRLAKLAAKKIGAFLFGFGAITFVVIFNVAGMGMYLVGIFLAFVASSVGGVIDAVTSFITIGLVKTNFAGMTVTWALGMGIMMNMILSLIAAAIGILYARFFLTPHKLVWQIFLLILLPISLTTPIPAISFGMGLLIASDFFETKNILTGQGDGSTA